MTGSRGLCEETLGSLEFAWPHRLSRRDPWAGDEVTPEPASYANYLSFGAASGEVALDEPEWARLDEAFMALYRGVLDGDRPWSELAEPARVLGLSGPAAHDRRPLDKAPERISDAVLADHVEDWVPDVGLLAPDRVLGPWSDEPLPAWVRPASSRWSPTARCGRSCPSPATPCRTGRCWVCRTRQRWWGAP